MKIVRENHVDVVCFDDLEVGEVFRRKGRDLTTYMKCLANGKAVAIDLLSGVDVAFGKEERVIRIDGCFC